MLRLLCWLSLLATLSIFVWLSPRGFEFTDESFYLLSLSWWRDITTSISLVGLVFGPIFQLISEDIALFRVIGIFLLLGSGAWMAMAALHFIGSVERRESKLDGVISVVVMAAATLYYSTFNVLRVPSYNLLAVCALMLSTGSLFRLLAARSRAHRFMLRAVEYGVFVSLCAAGKISTGVMVGIFHLCVFAVLVDKPRMKALLSAVLCAILGCCLVAAALLLARHDAIEVVLNGLSFLSAQDPGRPYQPVSFLNSLRWDLQRQVAGHWRVVSMVLVGSAGVCILRDSPSRSVHRVGLAVMLMLCGATQTLETLKEFWLTTAAVCIAWMYLPLLRHRLLSAPDVESRDSVVRHLGLAVMLLSMPIAFSYGTNNRVLTHSVAAAAPAVLAICLGIRFLADRCWLTRWDAALGIIILVLPSVSVQFRIIHDLDANYRQRQPIATQEFPVFVGPIGSKLLVDAQTQQSIERLQAAAARIGISPGTPVQDFTGDGSGLMFLLGVKPLASAWTGGGYPGSEAAMKKLLGSIDNGGLKQAWLISSEDNPRAIKGWQQLLADRLGEAGTHELAITVKIRAPYDWAPGGPQNWTVSFWRPVNGGHSSGGR